MKKIMFKSLSILLAAVLLIVASSITVYAEDASPTSVCHHAFKENKFIFYSFKSKSVCVRNETSWEACISCGIVVNSNLKTDDITHDTEMQYTTYYSTHSNEYHNTVEYLEEFCICCEHIINSYEEYFALECHVFNDTVDPEYDTSGRCILCGDEVSW
jgi:hypothetical protein